MFSYIYSEGVANQRGLTYYVAAKTEKGINKLALEFIRNMLTDNGAPNGSALLKTSMDAVQANDLKKAIETWNEFVTTELKRVVAIHDIHPITFIE